MSIKSPPAEVDYLIIGGGSAGCVLADFFLKVENSKSYFYKLGHEITARLFIFQQAF